jgi:transposase
MWQIIFMARPRRIDLQLVHQAREVVKQTQQALELRQALAVLLPAELGSTLEQTAQLLGVGRATVPRLQASFRQGRRSPGPGRSGWGGRRRALMSAAEEQAFLQPWTDQAKTGGVLVVSPIRAALAQRLGRPVAASVVYRFLARHGWRKVAPDTHHPKSDPLVQEAWKKNFRKIWRPCSNPKRFGDDPCA